MCQYVSLSTCQPANLGVVQYVFSFASCHYLHVLSDSVHLLKTTMEPTPWWRLSKDRACMAPNPDIPLGHQTDGISGCQAQKTSTLRKALVLWGPSPWVLCTKHTALCSIMQQELISAVIPKQNTENEKRNPA